MEIYIFGTFWEFDVTVFFLSEEIPRELQWYWCIPDEWLQIFWDWYFFDILNYPIIFESIENLLSCHSHFT